jgi:protein-S-isoprenylcysteine O-methyltransferase Ste14
MAEDTAAPHASDSPHVAGQLGENGPGVRIPAPFIHLTFILLGLLLQRVQPWPLTSPNVAWWLGAVLVTLVSIVSFLSSFEFARAGTSMLPNRPSSHLITRGPYRFSRNPIYLSLAMVHFGIGIWLNSGWLAISVLPCIPILDRFLIQREERYLEQRFGQEYRDYAARVRRWI